MTRSKLSLIISPKSAVKAFNLIIAEFGVLLCLGKIFAYLLAAFYYLRSWVIAQGSYLWAAAFLTEDNYFLSNKLSALSVQAANKERKKALKIITHNLIIHADPSLLEPRVRNQPKMWIMKCGAQHQNYYTAKCFRDGWGKKFVYDWNVAAARAAVKLSGELFLISFFFMSNFHKKI